MSFADALQDKSHIDEYDESEDSEENNGGEISSQKYSSEEVS